MNTKKENNPRINKKVKKSLEKRFMLRQLNLTKTNSRL